MNDEVTRVLLQAHDEILSLRHQISQLTPKAHAYDVIKAVIGPDEPRGAREDVAWSIRNTVERMRQPPVQPGSGRVEPELPVASIESVTFNDGGVLDLTRPVN